MKKKKKKVTHPVSHLAHSRNLNFPTSNEKCNMWDRKGTAADPMCRSNICPRTRQCIIVSGCCCCFVFRLPARTSVLFFFRRCESSLHNKYRKGVLVCVCEMWRVCVQVCLFFFCLTSLQNAFWVGFSFLNNPKLFERSKKKTHYYTLFGFLTFFLAPFCHSDSYLPDKRITSFSSRVMSERWDHMVYCVKRAYVANRLLQ